MLDPSLIPLVQRLDRNPDDREAMERLTKDLEACGEYEVLAKLQEKVAGRMRDPAPSMELLHAAARTWASKVGDEPRALALWNQVLEASPSHEGAQLGVAGVYRRTGRSEQAEAVYRRMLARAVSPARKVPLLEALAELSSERGMGDDELAVRRELAVHQGGGAASTANRRALARLLVARSRAREAAGGEGETDPERREAATLLGLVAREGATGRATEFAQAALSLWAGEENALEVLEEGSTLKTAELITVRIAFLAANPKGARAARVRRDLSDAYLATSRPQDAIAVLEAAADDDAQAAQSLAKLYERLGRAPELARLLERMPLPPPGDARTTALRRRAQAWKSAGDRAAHLTALRALLDDVPAEAEALGEVERDCRLQGLLGELRDRLRAAAAVEGTDVAARVRWLREVAQLAERRFDDLADAHAAWERVERIATSADDRAEAQEALLRLTVREENWGAVLDRLASKAADEADGDESRRLWMRWAQVAREHRPDAARESEVLAKLRARFPEDDVVARALIDARRRAGDDAGVTEVLRDRIARSEPSAAASRWCQLAEHLERVGDLEASAEAWRTARTLDPSGALAWEGEARVLGVRDDREGQLSVLAAYADHPVAPGRRAGELYARAAQLAFDLAHRDRALQLAHRALRFNPGDDAMKGLVAALEEPGTAPVPVEELLAEAARLDREDAARADATAEAVPVTTTDASEELPVTDDASVPVPVPVPLAEVVEDVAAQDHGDLEDLSAMLVEDAEEEAEDAAPAAVPASVDTTPPTGSAAPDAETRELPKLDDDVDDDATASHAAVGDPADDDVGIDDVDDGGRREVGATTAEIEAFAGPVKPPAPSEPPSLGDDARSVLRATTEVPTGVARDDAATAEDHTPVQVALPERRPVPSPEPPSAPPAVIVDLPPELPEPVQRTAELEAFAALPPPAAPAADAPVSQGPPPPDEDSIIVDASLFGEPTPTPPAPAAAPAPVPMLPAPPPRLAPPKMPSAPPPALTAPPSAPPPPLVAAPPALHFAPPPVLQFNPEPVIAPLPPPVLQFNPEPVIAPLPPPVLQFNPEPVVAPLPPPVLQFNPEPVVAPLPPPVLQFNPEPVVAPLPPLADASWIDAASGDPFASAAPPAPVAAPAPEPAATVAVSFERVLLPMFEALLERGG